MTTREHWTDFDKEIWDACGRAQEAGASSKELAESLLTALLNVLRHNPEPYKAAAICVQALLGELLLAAPVSEATETAPHQGPKK
jgi:hypothetical protein